MHKNIAVNNLVIMENFFISKELVVLDKNQLLFEVLKAFCKK